MQVSIHNKVISELVTRYMHVYYVAAHRIIQTKNIQNMATFISNDVNAQ